MNDDDKTPMYGTAEAQQCLHLSTKLYESRQENASLEAKCHALTCEVIDLESINEELRQHLTGKQNHV